MILYLRSLQASTVIEASVLEEFTLTAFANENMIHQPVSKLPRNYENLLILYSFIFSDPSGKLTHCVVTKGSNTSRRIATGSRSLAMSLCLGVVVQQKAPVCMN